MSERDRELIADVEAEIVRLVHERDHARAEADRLRLELEQCRSAQGKLATLTAVEVWAKRAERAERSSVPPSETPPDE
jgi:hypothetical protein